MPTKRKAQPIATASKQPAKRRSKLAKDNDITADEEAEIRDAFALFSATDNPDFEDEKDGVIPTSAIKQCLIALNAPPTDQAELDELIETIDPDDIGWVTLEHFVAIAALKMHAVCDAGDGQDEADSRREEVAKAYRLFTRGNENRPIVLADLKRITKELREDVPDQVLKDMLREASGGRIDGVTLEEFQDVMHRAGVFG